MKTNFAYIKWNEIKVEWKPAVGSSSNGLLSYTIIPIDDNCANECPTTRCDISFYEPHRDHSIWAASTINYSVANSWYPTCKPPAFKLAYSLEASTCDCGTLIGEFILHYCVTLKTPKLIADTASPCPELNCPVVDESEIRQLRQTKTQQAHRISQLETEARNHTCPEPVVCPDVDKCEVAKLPNFTNFVINDANSASNADELNRLGQLHVNNLQSLVRDFQTYLTNKYPNRKRTVIGYRKSICDIKQGHFSSTQSHTFYEDENYCIVSVSC